MKKSLVALAVLAASGAVMAQSSVTIAGKVNVGYQKLSDTPAGFNDVHGSRWSMSGVEDLGGGMKATFGFEQRFAADTGLLNTAGAGALFNGYSKVGLAGGFGAVNFGRQYNAGFLEVTNSVDPFGGDGVAELRSAGMGTTATFVRVNNSIRYDGAFGPVKFGVSHGLSEVVGTTDITNLFASYTGGPVAAAIAYGKGGGVGIDQSQTSLFGAYNFGVVRVILGMNTYDDGTAGSAADGKGYLLGLTAPVGSGVAKFGYARSEVGGVTNHAKFGMGYQYNLSKRTSLEFNYGKDSENGLTPAASAAARALAAPAAPDQSGYEFVLTHNF